MNRTELQLIAETRLQESRALLAAGFPDGAYYLAGYAVECALKACIAKRTQEHDFPDKKLVNDSHTHDLGKLITLAKLNVDLQAEMLTNPAMQSNIWLFRIGPKRAGMKERAAKKPLTCYVR
jgi:HEPN domain-containing protein